MQMIDCWLPHGGGAHKPRAIVVHAMAEYIRYQDKVLHAVDWLDHLGWSTHVMIPPNGPPIRCRRDNEIAWHAKGHNYQTLGVEVIVPGEHKWSTFVPAINEPNWVPECQYQQTMAVIREWMELWPIEWIKRHSDIDSERKIDPGSGFPWQRLLDEISL